MITGLLTVWMAAILIYGGYLIHPVIGWINGIGLVLGVVGGLLNRSQQRESAVSRLQRIRVLREEVKRMRQANRDTPPQPPPSSNEVH